MKQHILESCTMRLIKCSIISCDTFVPLTLARDHEIKCANVKIQKLLNDNKQLRANIAAKKKLDWESGDEHSSEEDSSDATLRGKHQDKKQKGIFLHLSNDVLMLYRWYDDI
jgi:hypothetical protein